MGGRSYLFLTPADVNGNLRAAYKRNGSPEVIVQHTAPLSTSGVHHVALVVDDANDELRLYLDGARVDTNTITAPLSDVNDINNWLGRSQYSADPELSGALHEFRLYGSALTDLQLSTSYMAGPDATFLP